MIDTVPCLRWVEDADGERLHELFCLPDVYRYLADGAAPDVAITRQWIRRSHAERQTVGGIGLRLLIDADDVLIGCVRTHLLEEPRTAELTYVLHPAVWGRGLATRMGWTAMQAAFDGGAVERIIAGTDDPNTASRAVMERLAMRFLRSTRNPRWRGVEYLRERRDPPPDPIPEFLTIR